MLVITIRYYSIILESNSSALSSTIYIYFTLHLLFYLYIYIYMILLFVLTHMAL